MRTKIDIKETAARMAQLRASGHFEKREAEKAVAIRPRPKRVKRPRSQSEITHHEQVLGLLNQEYAKAGFVGTFSVLENADRSLTVYAELNGKRCFVQMQDCTYQPKPRSPCYSRARPSLEMVDTHDVFINIINIRGRPIDIYIIPTTDARKLFFPNGLSLAESKRGKVITFPYPANELSKFEKYRHDWTPLV